MRQDRYMYKNGLREPELSLEPEQSLTVSVLCDYARMQKCKQKALRHKVRKKQCIQGNLAVTGKTKR